MDDTVLSHREGPMNARVASALFLALGFAAVTHIAVFIEPGMGFESPADFLDPRKVAAGLDSVAWRLEGPLYLALPVPFWVLARGSDDRYLVWSGVAAGVLFFVVGAIDRTMAQLPGLTSDADAIAGIAAMLPVRLAVLKATVVAIGVFAWRTTRTKSPGGVLSFAWQVLGYLVLAVSLVFLYIFVPAPLAFAVWAIALTARELRSARLPADSIR
jgi:hypothetical protein